MHFYIHFYLHKIFILVKSGCYTSHPPSLSGWANDAASFPVSHSSSPTQSLLSETSRPKRCHRHPHHQVHHHYHWWAPRLPLYQIKVPMVWAWSAATPAPAAHRKPVENGGHLLPTPNFPLLRLLWAEWSYGQGTPIDETWCKQCTLCFFPSINSIPNLV
jgi:hypothetical protein